MSYYDEQRLLRMVEENNIMLRRLLHLINEEMDHDFMQNVVANLFANGMERRRR